MEPTMFAPQAFAQQQRTPGAADPSDDEAHIAPPPAFTFNANTSLASLSSEKAVETLFASLSPLRPYTPYYFGVFDSPLRPALSLTELEAPLLAINRRYHQSNRRSSTLGHKSNSPQISSHNQAPVTPFLPPTDMTNSPPSKPGAPNAASSPGFVSVASDIKRGLMEFVNEFESLDEDSESNESEGETSDDRSNSFSTASKRSKRKKDFDMTTVEIVQNMPGLLSTAGANARHSTASGSSSSSFVAHLMTTAAEIPNPTPVPKNVTGAKSSVTTQRLIDMVKKTAAQQTAPSSAAGAASSGAQLSQQGLTATGESADDRTVTRGRKRKAKTTASLNDNEDDSASFDQDDELVAPHPTGAIVVRHQYASAGNNGSGAKSGSAPAAFVPPSGYSESDEVSTDDEEDDDAANGPNHSAQPPPRVAPAAGVIPPGASGVSPVLSVRNAATTTPNAISPAALAAATPVAPAALAAAAAKRPASSPAATSTHAAAVHQAAQQQARTSIAAAHAAGKLNVPSATSTAIASKLAGGARKSGAASNRAAGAANVHTHHHHSSTSSLTTSSSQIDDSIWNVEETEERKRVKEYWLSLTPDARAGLIKLEKDAVLRKMKEQQKHTCTCSVCGKRRTAIEEELEMLYDAYYDELERYTERQTEPGGFSFFKNLGAKGGMLSVANDLMKNEGKKFLEMMERLADRRMKQNPSPASSPAAFVKHLDAAASQPDHASASAEASEESNEDDHLNAIGSVTVASGGHHHDTSPGQGTVTEEQRLEEGKRMFQMFAAKMFEQRILAAYREKVAYEKQQKLIEEEEERERQAQLKKDVQKKKREAKKAKRKNKQEEEARLERERKEKEEKEKEEKARAERERKEQIRKQKEEEEKAKRLAAQAEEEERKKKIAAELQAKREIEERERERKRREEAEAAETAAAIAAVAAAEAAEAAAAAAAQAAMLNSPLEEGDSGEGDDDDEHGAGAYTDAGALSAASGSKRRKKRQRKNKKNGATVSEKADVYIPGMVKPGTVQNISSVVAPLSAPVLSHPSVGPATAGAHGSSAAQAAATQKTAGQPAPAAFVEPKQPRGGQKWRERTREHQQQQQQAHPQYQILEKPHPPPAAAQPSVPVVPVSPRQAAPAASQPAAVAPRAAPAPNPNAPVFTPPARPKGAAVTSTTSSSYVPPSSSNSAFLPPLGPGAPPLTTANSGAAGSAASFFPNLRTDTAAAPAARKQPAPTPAPQVNIDLKSVANLLPSTLLPALEGTPPSPMKDRRPQQPQPQTFTAQSLLWNPTPAPNPVQAAPRRSINVQLEETDDVPEAAKSVLSSILSPDDEIISPVRRSAVSPKLPAKHNAAADPIGWGSPLPAALPSGPGLIPTMNPPPIGPIGGVDPLSPLLGNALGGSSMKSVLGGGSSMLKPIFIDNDLTSFYRGSVVDSSIWGSSALPLGASDPFAPPPANNGPGVPPGFGNHAPIGSNKPFGM